MVEFKSRRDQRRQYDAFRHVRNADVNYRRQLVRIARHVGDLINGFPADDPELPQRVSPLLDRYAEILKPWATNTAQRMLNDVNFRDKAAWKKYSKQMGVLLDLEISEAPVGQVMRALLDEQVELITSLPIEAGLRVHKLSTQLRTEGGRFSEIIGEIYRSGEVTASRAKLIARTETARVGSVLTESRATSIGSEGYIWRTVRDSDVRDLHRKLEGKFIRWNEPPVAAIGRGGIELRAHAGQIFNCRCYAEPVLPAMLIGRK